VERDFFFTGETVQDFIANSGDVRPRFEQLLAASELSEDLQRSAQTLPSGLNVLVIAEPWSGDVLFNLPPLIRLAEAAGWEMRIFRRDRYPDLILPYLKDGIYHSIPVVLFYDRDFNELSHWVERPALATRVIDEESLKLRRRLRAENEAEWRQETFKEFINLVKNQA
jgi:hypothetical protein